MKAVQALNLPWNRRPSRVAIEDVVPEIDGGRFPIKRVVGEEVAVSAIIHADGHDLLAAKLLYRLAGESSWREAPMQLLANDCWRGRFTLSEAGRYEYTIEAWVDHFASWRDGFEKKAAAAQDVSVDLLVGAELIEAAAGRAAEDDASALRAWAASLLGGSAPMAGRIASALNGELGRRARAHPDRSTSAFYEKILPVTVDRRKARFAAWYEMFPRSAASEPGRHGTFRDCEQRLEYIAGMGFDILYFPPIHPIGRSHRKGRNNVPYPNPNDVGSPWAIGSPEGGHMSIHPQLGTFEDFRHLVDKVREAGMEIALDLALQCSPDHPWIKEHPGWFRHRPDGSIQYAENPPKKYEDIVPLDFETEEWESLYRGLLEVVLFWIEQGVRIFRVDNPHTKAYSFWEWMIGEVKRQFPEVIFLAEAFTRPHVMNRLAKLGFTQSYTYFTWRNTSSELREYMTGLTASELAEYFRPNLWPNTPDILPEYLQIGGRPAFQLRLILAATLGASYGIYGPAFELCVSEALSPGAEEYRNSEKYEVRSWDLEDPEGIRPLISHINRLRKDNPALQSNRNLRFHAVSNENLLAYSKHTDDLSNIIIVVANLDVKHVQAGHLELPAEGLGIEPGQPYQVQDLLTMMRYLWNGTRNYVEINPNVMPAHVFRLRRHLRRERDFDYYL